MEIFIIILLYFIVIFFDFLPVIKQKNKKQSILYLCILSLSFCMLILVNLNVELPMASKLIANMIKNFYVPG